LYQFIVKQLVKKSVLSAGSDVVASTD